MAVSEDTKAIISQLEKNAELMRSSNEDSNREVHVRLDKFADAFVSINANIRAQNQMLQTADKGADERLERERADRDFADLKREKSASVSSKELVGQMKSGFKDAASGIGDMVGKVFKGGLIGTIGTLLKGGLGAFVGYNFMKGFLGPKYDGMFESIESVLKQFAFNDLPNTLKNMADNVTRIAINFEENMNNVMGMFDDIMTALYAIGGFFGIKKIAKIVGKSRRGPGDTKYRKKTQKTVKTNRQLRIDEADRLKLMQEAGANIDKNAVDVDKNAVDVGDMNQNQPKLETNTKGVKPLGNMYTQPRSFGSYETNNFLQNKRINEKINTYTGDNKNGNAQGRNVKNGPGKGHPGAFLTQAQMDESLKQMGQLKWFKRFVKGAGAVGFIWGAYEMEKLYKLWISAPPGEAGREFRKQLIIDGFGATIGGMLGGAIGGLVGFFGGPFGILIGSIIGGVAGSMAGGLVAGYVYDWAIGKTITEKQSMEMLNQEIAKAEQQLTDASYSPFGQPVDAFQSAYAVGLTKRIHSLKETRNNMSAQHAMYQSVRVANIARNNQRNMETAAYGTGGRAMYEVMTNGTSEQKSVLLNSLIEVQRGQDKFFETIEEYMRSTNGSAIIHAPNNSSTIVAPVGGAVTKNDVNVLNTGSGSYTPHSSFGLPYSLN
jgi:hypothetical protein